MDTYTNSYRFRHMGSNDLNFNFGYEPPPENTSRPPPSNAPLNRQGSIYTLTFDEFQNSVGLNGKDFGSMNLDELLKSICSAEENNNCVPSSSGGGRQDEPPRQNGHFQRQGSLTLPRTLSHKTVDEIWRDISKEYNTGKDSVGTSGDSALPQRQKTLGEITLEEFLVKVGAVGKDAQMAPQPNAGGGLMAQVQCAADSPRLEIRSQQQLGGGPENMMGITNLGNLNPIPIQPSSNLPLNVDRVLTSQQQRIKQPPIPFSAQVPPSSITLLGSPGIQSGPVGLVNNISVDGAAAFQRGRMGVFGSGAGPVSAGFVNGLPANPVSSEVMERNSGDTSSAPPVPYMFNGGVKGRKGNSALDKVVDRRQRRMIKNRESAARSRARKQAYTMELEAEIAKLKEENEELRKKHVEIMEIQKNKVILVFPPQNVQLHVC
ncbi:hypothetical protein SAY86_013144 [Trapa natans]|uniref:BZIP domain-containing protein n=1 Tax=Trapa natans TaxID=22666 RepID=A0AAN7LY88_TRANT|nr:hypothetical protein SAY86_013144 [Trapa natans]